MRRKMGTLDRLVRIAGIESALRWVRMLMGNSGGLMQNIEILGLLIMPRG